MYQAIRTKRVLNRFGDKIIQLRANKSCVRELSGPCSPHHYHSCSVFRLTNFLLTPIFSLALLLHVRCAAAADNNEDIERENFSYYEYRVG